MDYGLSYLHTKKKQNIPNTLTYLKFRIFVGSGSLPRTFLRGPKIWPILSIDSIPSLARSSERNSCSWPNSHGSAKHVERRFVDPKECHPGNHEW